MPAPLLPLIEIEIAAPLPLQWTSFTHPDPTGEQLKALKSVISKLLEGKTPVRSNAILEGIYNSKTVISGAEWKERLPAMYVWVDYFSIPQPGASPHMKQDPLRKASISDHRLLFTEDAPEGAEVKLDADGDGKITMAELIEGLKNAVDSIPSYIERSSMTWVLVPPVSHTDLEGAVCDFNSWRNRGWCRMEFGASKLAAGEDMPLMVIESSASEPVFFNPCDTFKLCASHGDFSVRCGHRSTRRSLWPESHACRLASRSRSLPAASVVGPHARL